MLKKIKHVALGVVAGWLSFALISGSVAYAAWPSNSARTKTWGAEVLTAADLHTQFDLLHDWLNAVFNGTTGHDHTGGTNTGPKLSIASAIMIASQATGDVYYASSATANARLGIGSGNEVLGITGGVPDWKNPVINHYRREMLLRRASSTTITVGTGELDVNGSIPKTSETTLTLTTAGNWAGGSSLQATSTTGYVGVDASGNVKMHTTAPSHSDYAVSSTTGVKRYVTWGATVYRVIGWFRMNATGSGELDTYGVSNLAEFGIKNTVRRADATASSLGTTALPLDNTIPQKTEGNEYTNLIIGIVPTHTTYKLRIHALVNYSTGGAVITATGALFQDATANALFATSNTADTGASLVPMTFDYEMKAATTNYTEFKIRIGSAGGETTRVNADGAGNALYGGTSLSSIIIEELESTLD